MRRIYVLHTARLLLSPIAIKIYAVLIFSSLISTKVSIYDVVANMTNIHSAYDFLNFWLSALTNTETIIQLGTIIIATTFVFICRDIYHNLQQPNLAFQKN